MPNTMWCHCKHVHQKKNTCDNGGMSDCVHSYGEGEWHKQNFDKIGQGYFWFEWLH